jgi:gas vesicle protein
MSNQNTGAGALMLAFLAGAVTGAAVALLYAPAAGEETREYLNQRAREGRDRAREAVEQGREAIQRQREGVASAIDRGREAFEQARGEGQPA